MKIIKNLKKNSNKNVNLSNNITILNYKNINNLENSRYKNEYTNTLYNNILNKDNLLFNILNNIKKDNKNNKNNNKVFSMNNRRIFKNEILKINLDEYKKINDLSNTLFDKFKFLPNIKKYQNLTNEKLVKLTEANEDNSFIIHKQKMKYNNTINHYSNSITHSNNNKSLIKKRLLFKAFVKNKNKNKTFDNIRQYTLNSNYLDINYKAHIHKSWCTLFKKYIKPKLRKQINDKYKLTLHNTITSEESTNINNTFENKKLNKSVISQKTKIKDVSPKMNNFINNKKKGLRKSSAIDRFLFKLVNKDECFEDYISDGRPIDKYQYFKKQIEKNKKYYEKQLLELRRLSNINI